MPHACLGALSAVALLIVAVAPVAAAQAVRPMEAERVVDTRSGSPRAAALLREPSSPMVDVVSRYLADRGTLLRRYDVPYSNARRTRMREFYSGWRSQLRDLDFDALGREGQLDYLLLDNRLQHELALLEREQREAAEMAPLMPFADSIASLQLARRRLETLDPALAARQLDALEREITRVRLGLERGMRDTAGAPRRPATGDTVAAIARPTPVVAFRAMNALEDVRRTLDAWQRFYAGYHPLFTWWTSAPYTRADSTLRAYTKFIRETVVGIRPAQREPIIADFIGAAGLADDLRNEMLPYGPEEMIRIAEREFAWSEGEMKRASREMGFGDDWKAALEEVKTLHVEPGRQTDLARELAHEAVAFLESRELVTVPPLAKEVWRMEMLSPERQRVAPFFLGGEQLLVAFPTAEMSHDEKLMSLRGNNRHFSRAVVHHELIPGHHLQGFMSQRYQEHRRAFATPFHTEGWALYWEMLLWDEGFAGSPEDRVGMLFWRMHRSARIIFSLRAHLGAMTPTEAIAFLVDRVGHERANAEAEVRRSFNGTYPPLYQVAYMLGGLQFRALHAELVQSGRMTNRDFHDAILQGGPMPVELVRARLLGLPLSRDFRATWRFADR